MPGVGKSTLGVLLAKVTSRDFIDTDVYIQAREGRALQTIIDAEGADVFRQIEERRVSALRCHNTVIATGGSVVYGERAMVHLRSLGAIVHLHLPVAALLGRLVDFGSRGVVMAPGQTLESLFAERDPLYRRYADVTVDCAGLSHEAAVQAIMMAVGGR
jgi:shikimate kinase